MRHLGLHNNRDPIVLLGFNKAARSALFIRVSNLTKTEIDVLVPKILASQSDISLMATMEKEQIPELRMAAAQEYFFQRGETCPLMEIQFEDKSQCRQWVGGDSYWSPKFPKDSPFYQRLSPSSGQRNLLDEPLAEKAQTLPVNPVPDYSEPSEETPELSDFQKMLMQEAVAEERPLTYEAYEATRAITRETDVWDGKEFTPQPRAPISSNMVTIDKDVLDALIGTVTRMEKKVVELNTSVRSLVRASKKMGVDPAEVVVPAVGDTE